MTHHGFYVRQRLIVKGRVSTNMKICSMRPTYMVLGPDESKVTTVKFKMTANEFIGTRSHRDF